MLYEVIPFLAIAFFSGAIFGIMVMRYGLGLGSKLHIRAQNNEALDEPKIDNSQDYSK